MMIVEVRQHRQKNDGVSLSNNYDEGTDFGGCRDIDHKSENVQKIIKAYLKFLKEDMGYTGFRYDMVKGFSGSHVADYNDATGVKFSVGEYWDGNPIYHQLDKQHQQEERCLRLPVPL